MTDNSPEWLQEQAALSLARLLPLLRFKFQSKAHQTLVTDRLHTHFDAIFTHLYALYGSRYDFFYHLLHITQSALDMAAARPASLRKLDQSRLQTPDWFQSEQMLGGVCYVDLFAQDLRGIRENIPYFRELGLTYLHLMPLYKMPQPHNDGGYAVSSFRDVHPPLGTMSELTELAQELRANGISLVLDFVFNHTSDEHEWAQRALAGDPIFQDYYWMFPDRTLPDQYEAHLREIFPDQAPGSFTWRPEIERWVWTTFHPFQWDLNYANPAVFAAMLREILFLANSGAEVLRLDAVPFVWKQLGTNCENLPEVHHIIRAFNALVRVAAPALLFKSEAIVHPRDVRSYIHPQECQLSYNPIMMVSIWDALATRETHFFTHTMNKQFPLPAGCSWMNYLRSHDDIGWGFADEDAAEVGINGFDHRYFLNLYYTGRFPGSFATGLPFNFNPRTQDMRISGTLASLAGLEQAEQLGDQPLIDLAVKRILMIFGIVFAAGGIPLIYLGDEVGTLNNYDYQADPDKADDSRWVHRPPRNRQRYEQRDNDRTTAGRVFQELKAMIGVRKRTPALRDADTNFLPLDNRHVLAFSRNNRLLVLANFSEYSQIVTLPAIAQQLSLVDLLTETAYTGVDSLKLDAYQLLWLV